MEVHFFFAVFKASINSLAQSKYSHRWFSLFEDLMFL
jgi:hypothetical protein